MTEEVELTPEGAELDAWKARLLTVVRPRPATGRPQNLHVFDFDGTLFRSPTPSHGLWHSSTIGKLHCEALQGGLGWFQCLESLTHPYVPEVPPADWWVQETVDAAKQSMARERETVVVLLTGRGEKFRERVAALLQSAGVHVHHMGLKWDVPGTAKCKQLAVSTLLTHYPSVRHISIWEDRIDHQRSFEKFFKALQRQALLDSFNVFPVAEQSREMAPEHELALGHLLLARHHAGTAKHGRDWRFLAQPDYLALSLEPESRAALLRRVTVPEGWSVRADHMTIVLGTLAASKRRGLFQEAEPVVSAAAAAVAASEPAADEDGASAARQKKKSTATPKAESARKRFTTTLLPPVELGERHTVRVTGIARSQRVIAVRVEPVTAIGSANATPHVTVAFEPNAGKPADSNGLKHWSPFAGPELLLHGIVEERGKLALYSDAEEAARLAATAHQTRPGGEQLGEAIKRVHPEATGFQIGQGVNDARAWLSANPTLELEATNAKDLPLWHAWLRDYKLTTAAPPPKKKAAKQATAAAAALAASADGAAALDDSAPASSVAAAAAPSAAAPKKAGGKKGKPASSERQDTSVGRRRRQGAPGQPVDDDD